MTTSFGLGCDNDMQAQARASHRGQSPGFQRIRIGELLITALYDGFVPVPADDLHGAPPLRSTGYWPRHSYLPKGTSAPRSSPSLSSTTGYRS
jgi:hypothetical protein